MRKLHHVLAVLMFVPALRRVDCANEAAAAAETTWQGSIKGFASLALGLIEKPFWWIASLVFGQDNDGVFWQ